MMPADKYKYVIIGTGPAGVTAAETIRRQDELGTILMIGAETHCPYSRVMLPDLLTGHREPEQLCLHAPEHYLNLKIETALGCPVTRVDSVGKSVQLSDGTVVGYDRLLIATGAEAKGLDVAGGDLPRVTRFHHLNDALALRNMIEPGVPVLVYGGGLIALELAVALRGMSAEVRVAMRGTGFFSRVIGSSGQAAIAGRLSEHGVTVNTGKVIGEVREQGNDYLVDFTDGTGESVHSVVVGIGARPRLDFLSDSGIVCNDGIQVDDRMVTSATDVYAAGDSAWFKDPFSDRWRREGSWQNAVMQGRVAGQNMAGGDTLYGTVTGHAVDCFGLPIAFVGDVEDPEAAVVDRDYGEVGSVRLFLKCGRIVGATCVGRFSDRQVVSRLIRERKAIDEPTSAVLSDSGRSLSEIEF